MSELENKYIGKLNTKLDIKLVNIVATISFEKIEKINLLELLEHYPDVSYNPEDFPGAIIRLKKPKASFLVFSTGKLIASGIKTISLLEVAVKEVLHRFEKLGISFEKPLTKVVNMIGVASITNFLNLNLISLYLENCMYDPTIFPGLIYHVQEPKASFLLFSSGKIICTGVRDSDTLSRAILNLKERLHSLKTDALNSDTFEFEEYTFV